MGIGIIIYLALLAVALIFSILYIEYAAIQILITGILLPLFMLAVLFRLRKQLRVEIDARIPMAEKPAMDEPANVMIRVKVMNQSRFLPLSKGTVTLTYENRFTGEKGSKRLYFSADCKKERTIEIPLKIMNCGNLNIKIKSVKIHDYLSIFSCTMKQEIPSQNVLVVPPLKEIYMDKDMLLIESEGEGNRYSLFRKGDDPSEIFDIREFKEGDKLQRIHWKLSYKKDILMVKEGSLPLANATTLFVDFCTKKTGKKKLKDLNRLVQGVYSVSMALLDDEIPQEIIWYDNTNHVIRLERVTKVDELLWTFQEMFSCCSTNVEWELTGAYAGWHHGKPRQSALYLTINNIGDLDGPTFQVQDLQVINFNEARGEEYYEYQ